VARIQAGGIVDAMSQTVEHLTYSVPGVSCEHCRTAVATEVGRVAGVSSVEVDLEAKQVHVTGSGLEDEALRAAIDEAGYDVA
jgi:copper chaperone